MTNTLDTDIILATIAMQSVPSTPIEIASLIKTILTDCAKNGYKNPVFVINHDTNSIEVHGQAPDNIDLVTTPNDMSSDVLQQQYIGQMSVELPVLVPATPVRAISRSKHELSRRIRHYNRVQNMKYNMTLRNYNRHKK